MEDTDEDGVSDGKEIQLGTDPLVAQSSFNMNLSADSGNDKVAPSVEIELSGEQVETLRIDEVNNKVAQQRLGHSDVTTTLNIYSHVLQRSNQEAANTLDSLIFKQSANQ